MTCIKRLSAGIASALLLSACGSPHDPYRVPVTMMGTQGAGQANELTARAGDTPEGIAKKTNLSIDSLLEMNGLVSQQNLQAGRRLKTPMPQQIKVIEGDSIDTIARALGLKREEIAAANGLQPPYVLTRGQMLRLPSMVSSVSPATEIPSNITVTDLPPTENAVVSTPITTTQTATGAKVHSSGSGTITEEDLAPPPGAKKSDAIAAAPLVLTPSPSAPVVASLAPPTASLPPAKPITTLGAGVPSFSWPVNGSTLADYGPKAGGRHNDGMNIGAPLGTPVRAAAAGEVVYVGDNVAGFGNLILVRHSGGFATAYGHLQKAAVKRGDKVTAGQAIAQVGKTGNVSTPQLHFEIRKGTQPTNPQSYLP